MKAFIRVLASFVALASSTIATAAFAQPASTAPTVSISSVAPIRKGLDAWPLIANPSTPAEQRINATLTHLNNVMVASLKDCDANYMDWAKQVDDKKAAKEVSGDWQRAIRVTMTGPQYLSIVATDEVFCGGAHPDSDTFAMVFDLTTGRPVDWTKLIAPSAKASAFVDSITDGTKVGALVVPALKPMSIAKADKDCADAFSDPLSYQLWPDAKTGTLVAEPFDLPHVVAACADDLALTLDQARKLGFADSLLTAIDQAHRQYAQTKH